MKIKSDMKITGSHRLTLRHVKTGETVVTEFKNIIVSSGKSMIAKRLSGVANNCDICYGAVGSDATPPDPSDVILGAELFRKALTSRSYAGNQAFYTVYFGPNEGNGTLREYALFGEDADITADSGTMLNRALIDVTKTSSYTMTIDSTITIS